jgi:hypothetical protein
MYQEAVVVAIRRIQDILALSRKHGVALADDGCADALERAASSSRAIRFSAVGSNEGRTSRSASWTRPSAN